MSPPLGRSTSPFATSAFVSSVFATSAFASPGTPLGCHLSFVLSLNPNPLSPLKPPVDPGICHPSYSFLTIKSSPISGLSVFATSSATARVNLGDSRTSTRSSSSSSSGGRGFGGSSSSSGNSGSSSRMSSRENGGEKIESGSKGASTSSKSKSKSQAHGNPKAGAKSKPAAKPRSKPPTKPAPKQGAGPKPGYKAASSEPDSLQVRERQGTAGAVPVIQEFENRDVPITRAVGKQRSDYTEGGFEDEEEWEEGEEGEWEEEEEGEWEADDDVERTLAESAQELSTGSLVLPPGRQAPRVKTAVFVKSSSSVAQCPKDTKIPEFAVIGRSNVGKSSLINMLTNHKGLAQTSKKPGKTQLINHFLINDSWYLVDLPGYGYAVAPNAIRTEWNELTKAYFTSRSNLLTVLLLVDATIPPQAIDVECADWLGRNKIPLTVVFTKCDRRKKAKKNGRPPAVNAALFRAELAECYAELPPWVMTSAVTGEGKDALLSHIAQLREFWRR
ncbi:hypothetical protein CLOM_g7041 [Closterium sp. NIES-68]|nr:hypothetical protein CLOM_g7041 [Closterium sp. NIES-68]GJP62376.1 hypothetical protein CLOP_g19451 [Closterium sp. NIES-67]